MRRLRSVGPARIARWRTAGGLVGRWCLAALALSALAAGRPDSAAAQLISPGKLSAPHQELEGIRNCTQCHRLRQKGVDRDLCLECHAPLAARLERSSGFHATLPEDDCAACHKEHFGVDFDVLHLDTLVFDHERTGYPLKGLHADAGCRGCHVPDFVSDPAVRTFKAEHDALARTYLGLGTTCVRCHQDADPHRSQFEDRGCDDCHETSGWDEAPGFDHQNTRYPLTGAHRRVECVGCHEPLPAADEGRLSGAAGAGRAGSGALRFIPVAFSSCTSCHDDPHAGSMRGRCESCHGTGAWASVDRDRLERTFDHGFTGFELEGGHARLTCAACHDAGFAAGLEGITLAFQPGNARKSYPPPRADGCASCHDDAHDGDFANRADGGVCQSCHDQERWLPASYDLARHNAESAFPLEGGHLVTPCSGCHRTPDGSLRIRLGTPDCAACHSAVQDPHQSQFEGRDCQECHGVEGFVIPDFDHDRTRYRLEGAHLEVTCAGCHPTESAADGAPFVRYRPLGTECVDCHEGGR